MLLTQFINQFLFYLEQFAFLLFFLLIGLYIIGSMGLAEITKKLGQSGDSLAWLPGYNIYLLGKISFSKSIGWIIIALCILCINFNVEVNGTVMLNGSLVTEPFRSIGLYALVGLLLASLYKIYNKFSTEAITMTVLSFLSFGFLVPVFLFAIRKNSIMNFNTDKPSSDNTEEKRKIDE